MCLHCMILFILLWNLTEIIHFQIYQGVRRRRKSNYYFFISLVNHAIRGLYFSFVDLEKAFDRDPRKVVLWLVTLVSQNGWLILYSYVYRNPSSKVCKGWLLVAAFISQIWSSYGFSSCPPEAYWLELMGYLGWDKVVIVAECFDHLFLKRTN